MSIGVCAFEVYVYRDFGWGVECCFGDDCTSGQLIRSTLVPNLIEARAHVVGVSVSVSWGHLHDVNCPSIRHPLFKGLVSDHEQRNSWAAVSI
jgi:hypothetical protein